MIPSFMLPICLAEKLLVKLRTVDGASFAGDSEYNVIAQTINTLYFRGKRIWDAIIQDLLPKGLMFAEKALLSGCSAGGLATFIHCDEFAQLFPETTCEMSQ
ncbi:hypothetical protein J5N97_013192 [Dioscorea zingiberensis]|uniref:Pectin acetylesterase n=1 Tax=Dioscorea zingiberensis TaxID=325984 RepID=A0A9D5HIK3_9LILI|nr:hypothetical protein J5N97_013192 [Dioscorea zingiberensis]